MQVLTIIVKFVLTCKTSQMGCSRCFCVIGYTVHCFYCCPARIWVVAMTFRVSSLTFYMYLAIVQFGKCMVQSSKPKKVIQEGLAGKGVQALIVWNFTTNKIHITFVGASAGCAFDVLVACGNCCGNSAARICWDLWKIVFFFKVDSQHCNEAKAQPLGRPKHGSIQKHCVQKDGALHSFVEKCHNKQMNVNHFLNLALSVFRSDVFFAVELERKHWQKIMRSKVPCPRVARASSLWRSNIVLYKRLAFNVHMCTKHASGNWTPVCLLDPWIFRVM